MQIFHAVFNIILSAFLVLIIDAMLKAKTGVSLLEMIF